MPQIRISKFVKVKLEYLKSRNGHTSIDSVLRDLINKSDNKVEHIFTDEEFKEHFEFLERTKKTKYPKAPFGGSSH